jgi:hypothetical protein
VTEFDGYLNMTHVLFSINITRLTIVVTIIGDRFSLGECIKHCHFCQKRLRGGSMNTKRVQVKSGSGICSNFLGHIAVHGQHFVILDNGNSHVLQYNLESGLYMATIGSHGEGPGQFRSLTGVAFNSRGELHVSDAWLQRIQVFDEGGNYMRVVSFRVECPYGLAFTVENDLVVCDTNNDQVLVLSEYNTRVFAFGSPGKENGEFNGPCAVCIGRDGQIIVADSGNCRVQIFDKKGNFAGSIAPFRCPIAMAVGVGGEIAVGDFHHTKSNVHVYGSGGDLLETIQCPQGVDLGPRGVAMDKEGRVLVAHDNTVELYVMV